ncbi:MAG: hypothetical protein HY810_08475 [Candidatus Omnitrophica bacterium]|nr:hypothetical protein [Candidatus Omnitrophota bacterium]
MKYVFIRHNFKANLEALNELWMRRLVAVHFDDDYSTNPRDYDNGGRVALTRLWDYCKNGAVVGAYYQQLKPALTLVGVIKPDSTIKAEKIKNNIYKVVSLHDVKEVKSPLLLAIQPRQGTITEWPSAEKCLETIISGKVLPLDVNCLSPNQLEVICYEYLRKKKILRVLLMPIGRTLRDVDIWGIDDKGQVVLAQVTFAKKSKNIKEKIEKLKLQGAKNDKLFFFGRLEQKIDDKNMEYISIEEVFDDLKTSSETTYLSMLQKMVTYEIVG